MNLWARCRRRTEDRYPEIAFINQLSPDLALGEKYWP